MGGRSRNLQKSIARDEAWAAIQNGSRDLRDAVHAGGIGVMRIQLAVIPSFSSGWCWHVRTDGHSWRLFRSRVVVQNGIQAIGYCEMKASSDNLAKHYSRLASLVLPIAPALSDMAGLDGTRYVVGIFGDLHSEVWFQWWMQAPSQWSQLDELAKKMEEEFGVAQELESEGLSEGP